MATLSLDYRYVVGGALRQHDPTYVVRQSDDRLYRALKANDYCYVFNSRQMGKSSLRVQVMQRLVADDIACGVVEVSSIVEAGTTSEQWYLGMIRRLSRSLGLKVKVLQWWRSRDGLSPLQRFSEFVEDVLLTEIQQPIIIFIDEIDSLFKYEFNDDFFALIRAFYQERSDSEKYRRLSFVMLGVATPSDLIRDKRRTSFNIGGQFIDLQGFCPGDTTSLEIGLAGNAQDPSAVLTAILDWTNGQPFLTQRLCQLMAAQKIGLGEEAKAVAKVVRDHIIQDWEAQDIAVHLKTIRDRLLASEERSGQLLGLYQNILQADRLPATGSEEQIELRLTGLIRQEKGCLNVANPIYQAVFSLEWTQAQLQLLRPYGEAIAAWLNSNSKGDTHLLKGETLQSARLWAAGKRLSNDDRLFLDACQDLHQRELQKAKTILTVAKQEIETHLHTAKDQLITVNKQLEQE